MLRLTLTPGEYLTIGEGIVVQLCRSEGRRAYLAIDAPKEVKILRGAVAQRQGEAPPQRLIPVKRS